MSSFLSTSTPKEVTGNCDAFNSDYTILSLFKKYLWLSHERCYVTAVDINVHEKHLIQHLKFSRHCDKQICTHFCKIVNGRGTGNKSL